MSRPEMVYCLQLSGYLLSAFFRILSFSYGIVEIPEDHTENIQVDDIIQKADTLMYLQKRSHYQKMHKNSGENKC